jgi:glycosyltransferase involved in cell wall biosynthesis
MKNIQSNTSSESTCEMHPCIVLVGPFPPPYQGVTLMFQTILKSSLNLEFTLLPLNMSYGGLKSSPGGEWSFNKMLVNLKRTHELIKILRKQRPQIVYMALPQTRLGLIRSSLWILLAKRFSRCIIHLHGSYFRILYNSIDPLSRILIRQALSRVDSCIVLSEQFRSMFSGLIPYERIFVVPNGVSEQAISHQDFQLAMERRRMSLLGPLKVVFLSNLFESKGFSYLLEAAAILAKRGLLNHYYFVLAGLWENKELQCKWQAFVQQNLLSDHVYFPGVISGRDKFQLLLDSDVFVLPTTQYEGQPLSIIEAMAAGLPIIATDQGCITEMVRDGINGFIVPQRDAISIADRLELLRLNPDLRFRMGKSSRSLYLLHYTEDVYIRGLKMVFLQVLQNK